VPDWKVRRNLIGECDMIAGQAAETTDWYSGNDAHASGVAQQRMQGRKRSVNWSRNSIHPGSFLWFMAGQVQKNLPVV
jgi:hypothetical protein